MSSGRSSSRCCRRRRKAWGGCGREGRRPAYVDHSWTYAKLAPRCRGRLYCFLRVDTRPRRTTLGLVMRRASPSSPFASAFAAMSAVVASCAASGAYATCGDYLAGQGQPESHASSMADVVTPILPGETGFPRGCHGAGCSTPTSETPAPPAPVVQPIKQAISTLPCSTLEFDGPETAFCCIHSEPVVLRSGTEIFRPPRA